MQAKPFRLPVQWVNRPDADFRGFSGTIASGIVRPGDPVRIAPSGRTSAVDRLVTYDGDLDVAVAGQAVTLTLTDEIDVSRGDVIAGSDSPPEVADQFEATIVWMGDEPMLPGRSYLMRVGTRTVGMTIAPLKYKVNPETLDHVAATRLELNEIGVCAIELAERIAFDPYDENSHTGGFVVVDRISRQTVGAGTPSFCAAPVAQRALAVVGRRQGGPGRREGPTSVRGLAHRVVGRGEVDDREPRGAEPCTPVVATPTSSTGTTSATG